MFYIFPGITLEELNTKLAAGMGEDIHMDFKDSRALSEETIKNDLSKDVAAFANAAGGTILIGVAEPADGLPYVDTTGVNPANFTEEWLDQVIDSSVSPRIEGIRIFTIQHPKPRHVLYAINVPPSENAPHQARDKRFYKRLNTTSRPMDENEIRTLYFRNIISQSEFNKLREKVRETIYKPLYSEAKTLEEYLKRHPHPDEIVINYPANSTLRVAGNFVQWSDIKNKGHAFDLKGIGDSQTEPVLDLFLRSAADYNVTVNPLFDTIARFISNISIDSHGWEPVFWHNLGEAIIQRDFQFKSWELGLYNILSHHNTRFPLGNKQLIIDTISSSVYDRYGPALDKVREKALSRDTALNGVIKHLEKCLEVDY